MESKVASDKPNESSLSESWNVVDAQDVNNISEGSDGESIEVLDEESHANADSTTAQESDQKIENVDSTESPMHGDNHSLIDILIQEVKERIQRAGYLWEPFENWARFAVRIYAVVAVMFAAVIAAGICAYYVLSIDQVIFGTRHLIYPSKVHNEHDYQNLLDQLRAYKEESEGLKGVVDELNAAVTSLRKELNHQKISGDVPKFDQQVSEEDKLFQKLLSIHSGTFMNDSKEETKSPEGKTFRLIESLMQSLEDGKEKEGNLEIIRFFSNLPKHLSVLSNFDPTNRDVQKFINTWKEKLPSVNKKLTADINRMQLIMIDHIVSHLKSTHQCFFMHLCILTNTKKEECMETFLKSTKIEDLDKELCFIGPDNKVVPGESVLLSADETCDDNLSCRLKFKPESTKYKLTKKRVETNEDESDEFQYNVENKNIKKNCEKKVDGKVKLANTKDSNVKKKFKNVKPTQYEPLRKVRDVNNQKGMESDLLDHPHVGKINSFSSFSETSRYPEEGEKGLEGERSQRKQKEYLIHPEGSWFLRLGSHRSRLRFFSHRGDWLFDRARYRRRRTPSMG